MGGGVDGGAAITGAIAATARMKKIVWTMLNLNKEY
jgi:hypothetical protein